MAKEVHGPLTIHDGWEVYSADGEDLGKVDGLQDGYFKVNVHFGHDYFLRYDLIERKQDDAVYLRVNTHQLEHEKIATSVPQDSSEEAQRELTAARGPATATERRYAVEADYLKYPRPQG